MGQAESRCVSAGERWTEPRRQTYELLFAAGGPVKAYDLIARYKTGGPSTKPPTVYRALDFLLLQGLAHRLESLNAYLACDGRAHAAATQFLICDCCGATTEQPFELDGFLKAAQGFELRKAIIEIRGQCAACSSEPCLQDA
jgi:Fur family zinc uptake transcriptional regulator